MYQTITSVSFAVVCALLSATAVGGSFAESLRQKGFDLVMEKDGVTVYRHRDTARIRLVAEGRFAAPPERVRATLLDYERHVGVVDRVAESRILERRDDALLVYQRLALPIIDDRDVTLRVTWGGRRGRPWIAYEAVGGGPAVKAGVVRMRHYRGRWKLRAVEGGQATQARLYVDMEMGGSLPPALASSNAGRDVPALFAAISSLIGDRVSETAPR